MKKLFIIKLLNIVTIIFFNCNGQKNDNINKLKMAEKINIDELINNGVKTPISEKDFSYELVKEFENGASYRLTGSKFENGFVKTEIPVKPHFYHIYREFYVNGSLKKI